MMQPDQGSATHTVSYKQEQEADGAVVLMPGMAIYALSIVGRRA